MLLSGNYVKGKFHASVSNETNLEITYQWPDFFFKNVLSSEEQKKLGGWDHLVQGLMKANADFDAQRPMTRLTVHLPAACENKNMEVAVRPVAEGKDFILHVVLNIKGASETSNTFVYQENSSFSKL